MIEDGYSPTKLDGTKVVSKSSSKWDGKNFAMVNLRFKTISCIINDLTCSEFCSHEHYLSKGNVEVS